ncbi:MAG: DUF523 domain-containing protein, partial [Gammaproteobacteria bacterium]
MTETTPATAGGEIRVGVSACLLGARVRFDGGHKRNRYVDEVLRDYLEFVPFWHALRRRAIAPSCWTAWKPTA